jgi:hypothetical protein
MPNSTAEFIPLRGTISPLINELYAEFDRGVYPAPRDHFSLSFPVRRKDNIFLTFWNYYPK